MRREQDNWGRGAYSENNSDTESITSDRTGFSGPLGAPMSSKRGSKKSARFNIPQEMTMMNKTNSTSSSIGGDDSYVEITLDIRDDSVAVHSVQAGAGHEDPELALLAKKTLENSKSSSLFRNTSAHIKQVSQELKRVISRRSSAARRFDRTKSAAAYALKGLKFITSKTGSGGNAAWPPVEKRFDELTASTNGLLPASLFGECIGTYLPPLFTFSSIFSFIVYNYIS